VSRVEKIKAQDLRVGMYVSLSGAWFKHPFVRNQFKISSAQEIREIRRCGFREVEVDLDKSDPATAAAERPIDELAFISHSNTPADPRTSDNNPTHWNPETLVPPELTAVLQNKQLSPLQKSKAVYLHSREMMERLLESPTAENIHASKSVIGAITDMILSEDETAFNLLRITSHDFYTYTHSVNVGVMSIMLAKSLFRQSDAHDLHELGAGFFLHDLGKVNVDPAIINKPGRLTDQEMGRMRTHPYQGYKLLQEASALTEECRYIVMQHHELFDGSGYPKRLHGEEIHIYGKICCIADVFDALTSERSYKKSLGRFEALQLMRDKMLGHFQHELFDAFVLLFK
jgi:HD-GYP domain-containing protein (c-di-GMP phosphodiesterase class II)